MLLTSTSNVQSAAVRKNPTQRSETASRPRRLGLAWAAILLAYVALVPAQWVDGIAAIIVNDLAWAIAAMLATASCLRAARALGNRDRTAWIIFSIAGAAWAAGRLACIVYDLVWSTAPPFPTPGNLGYLAFGPLMIVGLGVLRSTQRERRLTWLRAANLGLILCGLAVVLISALTQPFQLGGLSMRNSVLVVVQSAAVTIAFIVALYVLWSYRWGDRFEPVALITICLALHTISALFYTRDLLTRGGDIGIVFSLGWLLAFACQQWAGESQVAIATQGDAARARTMLETQGWVEALVPSVLVMCIALTGLAFEEEITREVMHLGSIILALFAIILAVREGLLYARGQQMRARLQRASVELEQSREQLHDLNVHRLALQRDIELTARAGAVGLWNWDLRSNTVHYSREWKRQLGYDDDEITDDLEEWRARVHPEDLDRVQRLVKSFIEQPRGEFVAEQRLRHRDGSYRWILVQGSVLLGEDGKPHRMLGSHVDITELKNLELSLRDSEARYRELVDGLESRVTERTHELTEAYRESQSFAYAVAHDLKAPLRAIDGFSHLLEQSAMSRLNANEHSYIQRVRHGAIQMALLIDGLLAYSRLEHRPVHFSPVDCRELIEDVLRSMDPVIHAANASVCVSLPAHRVRVDVEGLRIAIRNLLDNALKFASPSRPLCIDISGYEQAGSLIVMIRDNGIGFEPQYGDKIFEIFNRLHSTGYEGTGIGLALVRKAIQRMHGRIWAEAAPDQGATFFVSLPLAEEATADEPPTH